MRKKKSLEEEINEFFDLWGMNEITEFLRSIIPLFELYNVDDEERWYKEMEEDEEERNKILIRTVYLVSKIAELHAGKLCAVKINFKNLYQKMEKRVQELDNLEVHFEKQGE